MIVTGNEFLGIVTRREGFENDYSISIANTIDKNGWGDAIIFKGTTQEFEEAYEFLYNAFNAVIENRG